jgi:hypothetical protein
MLSVWLSVECLSSRFRYYPKLQLLTKTENAGAQMRRFGCVGDKMEAAVEHLHQTCSQTSRLFGGIDQLAQDSGSRTAAGGTYCMVDSEVAVLEKAKRPRSGSFLHDDSEKRTQY